VKPSALALLVLVAAVYLAPEHLAKAGYSLPALEYSAHGVESACLWLILMLHYWRDPAAVVCAWGAAESMMRPLCRLALPLDRAPLLEHGQMLCEAAYGYQMGWVSVSVACVVAVCAVDWPRMGAAWQSR